MRKFSTKLFSSNNRTIKIVFSLLVAIGVCIWGYPRVGEHALTIKECWRRRDEFFGRSVSIGNLRVEKAEGKKLILRDVYGWRVEVEGVEGASDGDFISIEGVFLGDRVDVKNHHVLKRERAILKILLSIPPPLLVFILFLRKFQRRRSKLICQI
jgi:hypothetical protein